MERRAFEVSACTGVPAWFNGRKLLVKGFEGLVALHVDGGKRARVAVATAGCWEVFLAKADSYTHVSFVNGVSTPVGGTHVDLIVSGACKHMAEASSTKKVSVKPSQIKNLLAVFVRATVEDPTFDGQTKGRLTSKPTSFRGPPTAAELEAAYAEAAKKLGIVESAREASLEAAEAVERRAMKKTDGAARASKVKVAKLEDATWAGTARSAECTLFVTEGDSARTFAIAGLSVIGRDKYGVFALKGKPLNVRGAPKAQIAGNAELCSLKTILGLKEGKAYASLKELRYGRLCILADADDDGIHILGLVLNWLEVGWPALLKLGFACALQTPVTRAIGPGGAQREFYDDVSFRAWASPTVPRGWAVKHLKGLGSSTSADAKALFATLREHTRAFSYSPPVCADRMALAFDKTKANDRKRWLEVGVGEEASAARAAKRAKSSNASSVSEFVDRDLIEFSLSDVHRSIPSAWDGFKPSQRKVLYAMLARRVVADVKVAQLAGTIAELTSYEHGEASLCGTIVHLAQDFVGSNNLNLLVPSGAFGSRLQAGKDSASPRYIFTRLSDLTAKIFDPRDDALLVRSVVDGREAEFEHFAPVLPMVLVNGCSGIGTGYSCDVPPHDPAAIKAAILKMLGGDDPDELVPWYRGFKGTVSRDGTSGPWSVRGAWSTAGSVVHVTELPIGVSTDAFKERLDALEEKGRVASYKLTNLSTDLVVDVEVTLLPSVTDLDVEKEFGLKKSVPVSNLTLFSTDGKLMRYATTADILKEYFAARLALYVKRREILIADARRDAVDLAERARFINLVRSRPDLVTVNEDDLAVKQELVNGHAFLEAHADAFLKAPLSSLTAKRARELDASAKDARERADAAERETAESLWVTDLMAMTLSESWPGSRERPR